MKKEGTPMRAGAVAVDGFAGAAGVVGRDGCGDFGLGAVRRFSHPRLEVESLRQARLFAGFAGAGVAVGAGLATGTWRALGAWRFARRRVLGRRVTLSLDCVPSRLRPCAAGVG